jgi:hypothetical protein
MIIGGIYSFNNSQAIIEKEHPGELAEIFEIIRTVGSISRKTIARVEKTIVYNLLFDPSMLTELFKKKFEERSWTSDTRIVCNYSADFYTSEYTPSAVLQNAYREMDFIKNRLGVEIQFDKLTPLGYHGCAKMTIFHNEGLIDVGVEIVPLKELAIEMSTGVSYFEQFVWDLEHRGVSEIDIPVLILGIAG